MMIDINIEQSTIIWYFIKIALKQNFAWFLLALTGPDLTVLIVSEADIVILLFYNWGRQGKAGQGISKFVALGTW